MIIASIYNEETGDSWDVDLNRIENGVSYVVCVSDGSRTNYQFEGTIFNVEALSPVELVQMVLNTTAKKLIL